MYRSALVLAGKKLIFFTVTCRVLCFGFVMGTVLRTQEYFSYC